MEYPLTTADCLYNASSTAYAIVVSAIRAFRKIERAQIGLVRSTTIATLVMRKSCEGREHIPCLQFRRRNFLIQFLNKFIERHRVVNAGVVCDCATKIEFGRRST